MSQYTGGSYDASSHQDLRLLLLGNIGCGKTSTGDTLLGQLSTISPASSARSCQVRRGYSEGRRLTLVEAPRWYWSGGHIEASVRAETERALTLAEPGPHGVLLLVPVGQFTEMDAHVATELVDMFGEEVLDNTLVLLTCGDYLMGNSEQTYLQKEPGLRQMIERCRGNHHVINNRQRDEREQVRSLLEKVDGIVQRKGVYHVKTAQEKEMEKLVQERERELKERYRLRAEEKIQEAAAAAAAAAVATHSSTVETHSSRYNTLERRRKREEEEEEERVAVSSASNGLYSAPVTQQLQARPEVCEDAADHYRVSSFGERSPDAAPASSSSSTVSSSFASPSTYTSPPPSSSSSSLLPSSSSTSPPPSSSSSSLPPSSSSSSLLPSSSSTSPPPSPSSSSPSSPELRLVLLGRSGSGKSTVGNRILGREEFEAYPDSLMAITLACEKKRGQCAGNRVAVVDTPDWFKSESSPAEVRAQISSCVALSSPGPHAFLLCVPVDQPAKMELQALGALDAVFGPDAVQRHTLVLFTYADRLRESGKAGDGDVEAYIAGQRIDLLKLVERCGDRYHIMERGDGNAAELLEKVEQTVTEAGGQCYSCPAFQEAEDRVRQRQVELVRERKDKKLEQQGGKSGVGKYGAPGRVLYPSLQPLTEEEEEVREDEIEQTRDEAERSVSAMDLKSLPPISLSDISPSLLSSMREKLESGAKMLPKLLADGSMWVGEGAKKVASSPVWGSVGDGAKSVHKMVTDSAAWEKMGAGAGHVSKLVGENVVMKKVPKVMADGSAWAESGAKNIRSRPIWEKVGSGAKSGARLVADGSMRVGAGFGAGAKKVSQSPVWGKVGSGAKAGAKMVAESSVWERMATAAKKVPKVVIGGAVLGLILGLILGGLAGGALGAAAGSAASEVGRRKFSKNATEASKTLQGTERDGEKQGERELKTE
ncbi:uncharacterized protein LOC143016182 isoform X2 [Genypterus blacodes]|uniref:uncharacterized protein LOC143016182 isoform X2 n=1 Tax=Genypterus blacodes TaxID=154954 RepID=UPI003F76BD29